MSSAFAELMKLSQSQTAESEQAIESQIAAHRLQLEKKRKEQEAKEKREREVAAKRRLKHLAEQRAEEERKKKKAEEEVARQKELEKREAQVRDALRYGPKKAAASRAKSSDNKGDPLTVGDDDSSGPVPLTREEKRERKLAAQLRQGGGSTHGSRRSNGTRHTAALPDGRIVRRLPGGAVDVTIASRLANPEAAAASAISSDLANKPVRERLSAMPVGLMKLNTVKRDMRTIEEILNDRAKIKANKVLDGDDARDFSDWFGKKKDKEKEKMKEKEKQAQARSQSQVQSQPSRASPQRHSSDDGSRAVSATPSATSGSRTPTALQVKPFVGSAAAAPAPRAKPSTSNGGTNGASSFFKSINPKPTPSRATATTNNGHAKPSATASTKKRARSPSPVPTASLSTKRRSTNASSSSSISARVPPAASARPTINNYAAPSSLRATAITTTGTSTAVVAPRSSTAGRKHSRSTSNSDVDPDLDMDRRKLSKTIWSMFGGPRRFDDVYSDEEDINMEADARAVLKEEARSSRLAHKEDEAALAELRKREEDKRRRKKERERREREL